MDAMTLLVLSVAQPRRATKFSPDKSFATSGTHATSTTFECAACAQDYLDKAHNRNYEHVLERTMLSTMGERHLRTTCGTCGVAMEFLDLPS